MSASIVDVFESHRPKLIGLAYRITGSAFEAEDIVHETFIRWFGAKHKTINSPYSWLVTVTTRLALDYLKSAAVKRESYIGPWLPEPFIEEEETPEKRRELDESITMALLVLLDKLSPTERATYILHDLFYFSFDEIAEILGKPGATCRKLGSRARAKVESSRVTSRHDRSEHEQVISAFFAAVKHGDMKELVSVLQENVSFHSDGGGKALAAPSILTGMHVVSGFIVDNISAAVAEGAHEIAEVWFNGSPGFVVSVSGEPVSAFNFEIENLKIKTIHVLRNPDKLQFFSTVSEVQQLPPRFV